MPIVSTWHNEEKTIFRTDISGAWTWDEFHKSIDNAQQELAEVDHPVIVISVSANDAKSPGGNSLPHLSRAVRQKPSNQLLTITVTRHQSMQKIISKIMTNIFPFLPQGLMAVDTFEEALAIAEEKLREVGDKSLKDE